MNFTAEAEAYGINSKEYGATQLHPLGTRGVDRHGRVYRYVKAGASDLVAGDAIQSPAIVANHLANTPPAVAIGADYFTYTPGATAGDENQYAGGFLQIDTTPGNGRMYGVDGHPAITSATAFRLQLTKDDTPRVALTTSSRVGLIRNPYNGVIQMPVTTATGILVGVAVSAIPAGQFGWIQTWGYAAVLINGTPALGAMVVAPSATTAGAVDVITATNLVTAQIVGRMGQVGVSTKNNAVYLTIAP